jgi:transcriptional regulator with XRE-family HTH domain
MIDLDERTLEAIFGKSPGATLEERARFSSRRYIRSLDQLTEFTGRGTGRQLTASEALGAYGLDVLVEVAQEGSALLSASRTAAGDVLRDRRVSLELEQKHVARRAEVSVEQVDAAESSHRLPIRIYERIARVLGLDERQISVTTEPAGNDALAVRLRTLDQEDGVLTPSAVSAISEAAWVVMVQARLERLLNLYRPSEDRVSSDYGRPGIPAYQKGYELARKLRSTLGLGESPLPSIRLLAEDILGIPIVQSGLGDSIAGVTVEVGDTRAIVVNLDGRNRHVYVRRSTIAHELGHLLYDPASRLKTLRVDAYDALDRPPDQLPDVVEQRANAFAIELLAPQAAAVSLFGQTTENPLGRVIDEYGVSFTAARYQIWNGLKRSVPLDSITTSSRNPPQHWEAQEAFTIDYHPIRGLRPCRAGRFSALVVRAESEGLITADTAMEWLGVSSVTEIRNAQEPLKELFPAVFA